jgi:hypothetical protein
VAQHIASGIDEAAIVLLHRLSDAFYWIVGSSPGPSMTILIAHVFEHCAANNIRRFDFVGANTPSIADFKRRFGPKLTTYPSQVLVRPGLLRAVHQWKTRRRR